MVLGYHAERLPDFAGLNSIARPCFVLGGCPACAQAVFDCVEHNQGFSQIRATE
jgi:hypothetical protein